MTLLTICQSAADEVGINRPSAILSSTTTDALSLLRYAKRVGQILIEKGCFNVMRKEQTFTAIAGGTQTGILPSDFDHMVKETFWDRTNYRLIQGPITAQQYQTYKGTNFQSSNRWFTLRGGDVIIYPDMDGGESLAFEYVSKNYCTSSGGTEQSAWAADTDLPMVHEEVFILGIKLLYLQDSGQPAGVAFKDFNDCIKRRGGNDQPASGIMSSGSEFGRNFSGAPSAGGWSVYSG